MNEELAQYIREVAAARDAAEMLEDDLFLSSLLTDLVFGVEHRFTRSESGESVGMQRLKAQHSGNAVLAADLD